ncbi:phosphotransferase [Micromonospora sp. WMMD1102]|uniref:phosphotransferase family protein n=1 Tax=Micromonospora sp. WMMD1102 TaxID=3016105 RepID=UPI0024155C3F|nr:phosphotransferase [Micromonospora sp. WMMD1102]MDG4786475.1 phosphotransferase [Micromonospora sp. WMMD1102]
MVESQSSTRRHVTESELRALVRRGFGDRTGVTDWRELTGGTYNAAYAVTLGENTELVLKVAPPPELELLRHEVDLMRTEVDFHRRAARVGAAVPEVVYADFTRDLIGTDFVFLSRIPGTDLQRRRDELTPAQLAAVRAEIAAQAARLHTVTGPAYGYPLRESRSWQPSWRAAFGAMVDDILADAVRLGSALPAPPDRIGDLLRRHADVLDEVRRPALVHFDLWDGNVFVAADPAGTVRLTGLIDGERAFFGDPLAELVSMTLHRELDDEPEILAGYASAGHGRLELTGPARRRLTLYTIYLYLIMCIEGATRGWNSPERAERERWLVGRLEAQLDRLDRVRQ